MNFDNEAYKEWVDKEQDKAHTRYVSPKINRISPRLDKHRDVRKGQTLPNLRFDREYKPVRKNYQKSVRMKLKQKIYNEAYYNVRSRDYKTYGWITW